MCFPFNQSVIQGIKKIKKPHFQTVESFVHLQAIEGVSVRIETLAGLFDQSRCSWMPLWGCDNLLCVGGAVEEKLLFREITSCR